MRTVLVASSKGGCGKTTIATNLAGYYATQGEPTVLVDADPQGSSTRWCERRAALDAAVLPVDGRRRHWGDRVPEDARRVVVDAAAGAMAPQLQGFLEVADAVVVPVLPSAIDIEATVPFLDSLATHPRIADGSLKVCLAANRLKPWTNASQQALAQLDAWPYPVKAQLRDTQAYVLMVGLGRCLFDYHSEQVRRHQDDFRPLLRWLARQG